jgi:hypothetical protein
MRALWFYLTLALMALCLSGCEDLAFSATLDQWADAIHHAEGNDNYGILLPRGKRYKHTSYTQACKNTVKHLYRLWIVHCHHGLFINYLGMVYCPVGASNDPQGLNKYWIDNVRYWLDK